MDVIKPYKFIGFGAMDVTKPYKNVSNLTCLNWESVVPEVPRTVAPPRPRGRPREPKFHRKPQVFNLPPSLALLTLSPLKGTIRRMSPNPINSSFGGLPPPRPSRLVGGAAAPQTPDQHKTKSYGCPGPKCSRVPGMSPNHMNKQGLGPCMSPNLINLQGLGPWMSPNPINL
jgi:hypothetical protein